MSALTIAGSVVAAVAALIHAYIFLAESILWSRPATWKRFGIASQQDADTVRPMAYNQGFYNLFLGVGIGIGIVLLALTPFANVGMAIIGFGLLSMLLASIVLLTSMPSLWRAAALQGGPPLIALVLFVIAGVSA
jgi:putative membrane protein